MAVSFDERLPRERVHELIEFATADDPVEVEFSSGDWVGGVVLTNSSTSQTILSSFLDRSPAAREAESITGIVASRETVSLLGPLPGKVTPRPLREPYSPGAEPGHSTISPNVEPGVPYSGMLVQKRLQGLVEQTTHTLTGLDNAGYPADIQPVDGTQGTVVSILGSFGYEHDYKVARNGYVSTDSDYSWHVALGREQLLPDHHRGPVGQHPLQHRKANGIGSAH